MKWFKHDTDSNRDGKLEKVLMRYGAEGYALYWLCLELIAGKIDKHNINFELEHDSEILAYRLRLDSAKVEEMMRYMVGLGLFEVDTTTQRITCLKLAARIENSTVKSPHLLEIQQKLKSENIPDDPGQSGSDPEESRNIPDNLGKLGLEESREEKNREKDTSRFALPDWIPSDLWAAWMEIRRKKKAINSDRAKTALINKLEEVRQAGIPISKAMTRAIEKSWKSIEVEYVKDLKGQSNIRPISEVLEEERRAMEG